MKAISNIGKKRGRGRPATGATPVLVRIPPETLKAVDGWIQKQSEPQTRPQGILGLVELGLTVSLAKPTQAPQARADRAKELAAQAIDKMGDPAALPEDRAQRRRRLTKGPEEFQEVRVDRPKVKK